MKRALAPLMIILIIGGIIALGTLSLIFKGSNSSDSNLNSEALCPDSKTDTELSKCLYNISLETENAALCDEIPQDTYKAGCYKNIARAKLDVSWCKKSLFQEENCYYELAALENDETICENLVKQNVKDGCYFQMAALKKDISLCDKISDENSRTVDCPREIERVSR